MTPTESRRILAAAQTERDFQANIVRQARYWCWHVHYNTIAYRSPEGWPDLTLWRWDRIIVAELKTVKAAAAVQGTKKAGGLTEKQRERLWTLCATGKVEVYVWTPEWWHQIEGRLA